MKKALFLVATAVLTLASCGKSDDNPTTPDNPNTPIPNNPEPPKTTVVKRIKEVKITYLDRKKNSNDDPIYFLNGEPKFIYTLKNGVFSYEYDAQGRISKYTSNKGGEQVTYEFSYPQGKIIANSGKGNFEFPLDEKGYLKETGGHNYFSYDEKGQLSKIDNSKFIWKDGNLTAETYTSTSSGQEEIQGMKFSYYPNENKNRFFIFNNEERDEIDVYTTYFYLLNALPVGVPTKNILESISQSYTYKKENVSYATLIKFTYTYDKDGYVSRIIENRSGDDDGLSISSGSTSDKDIEKLEALIAKIKAGTIKNMTYKEFTNANGTYKFSITHKEHITKDSKGKPIDVKYEQERVYTFSYKEESGKRKYLDRKEIVFTKQDASTIYEISYY